MMEKYRKIVLYDFVAVKIVFREIGKMVSYGNVILTEAGEFAGNMNNDTILAYRIADMLKIIYHVETLRIEDKQFFTESYTLKTYIHFRTEDEIVLEKEYISYDDRFSISFQEVISDEKKALKVLSENDNLFIRP